METTTTQTALKWGAIAGIILIIFSVIGYAMKMEGSTSYAAISSVLTYLIVPISVLILGMKDYKRSNDGFMSYSQGLGIGALTGGVAGLLFGIFSYIYLSFIDNTVMQRIKDIQMQKLEEQGMALEQMEQTIQFMEKFTGPGMILVSSIIFFIIVYFLISLIVSAVQKYEKPIFS